MPQIRNWFITGDPYAEVRGNPMLAGIANVEGVTHGKEKDIMTSSIAKVDGRFVTTKSGRVYELVGEPGEYFRQDLEAKGFAYDPEKPLDCYLGDYIRV